MITLRQQASPPPQRTVDALPNLVILLPARLRPERWPSFPYRDTLIERMKMRQRKWGNGTLVVTDLPNRGATRITLAAVASETDTYETLGLARRLVDIHMEHNPAELACLAAGTSPEQGRALGTAIYASALARTEVLPNFKSSRSVKPRLRRVTLYGIVGVDGKRLRAEAEGNNTARALTLMPPNYLTPRLYRRRAMELARLYGWRSRFYDTKALKRKKAGAFLAVAQGSAEDDAGILHLRYLPSRHPRRPALALVGKGICYDTGGLNLKPAKHMHGMHEDMAGSAVALGTLIALTRLGVPFPVDCWLALAQNHIGPRAYKQNDVITAINGSTIEVMHTDAEGRMVLADTLAMASGRKPALILDYATLTGACLYALGSRYSGAFTNRMPWVEEIIRAGRASGERVWPFPMDDDYDRALESQVADIKQCTLDGEADHILAARFLSRFVGDHPWIHIDLSAASNKGGLAHIPSDTTGFGIRFTLNLLLDQKIMGSRPRRSF